MNQTASTLGNSLSSTVADTTSTITTIHLALIGLLALIVLVGVIYGARLKHRRKAAERAVVEHAHEAGVEEASVGEPMPVAPSPPPLSDAEAPGGATTAIADEPIAAAAPLAASPQVEAASAPTGTAPAADGPVSQIKGLGPKLASRLAELGITTVGQVAALDDEAAARLDAQLGPFAGRMARDRWIEQARFLAAGDRQGFEAVFGRL